MENSETKKKIEEKGRNGEMEKWRKKQQTEMQVAEHGCNKNKERKNKNKNKKTVRRIKRYQMSLNSGRNYSSLVASVDKNLLEQRYL